MTLEDYLIMREHQASHVLVAVASETDTAWPPPFREEVHPIPAEELAVLRPIWTKAYDDYQSAVMHRAKIAENMMTSHRKKREGIRNAPNR
jgi:hypothetical protein